MVVTRGRRLSHLGNTAIVGMGQTAYTKRADATVLELAATACAEAVADGGLTPADVDGIVSFSLWGDSVPTQSVATSLGIPELSYSLDLELGGQAPCFAVNHAAMAVSAGIADVVVVYRALKGRSELRIGSQRFKSTSAQYRYPIGFNAYAQYIAMWARRYMIETNATPLDLAGVAIAQSKYAALNPHAIRPGLLEEEDYWASAQIVDPFRGVDCTSEVDGACAVVVTSLERARDLPNRPVIIDGAAWATGRRSGFDIADVQAWPDYSRNCHSVLADRLWASSSIDRGDLDFAEIYDCFTAVVLMTLEGLGLAERGNAGEMIRSGHTALDGALPVNTHGGLLREGYLHGMNTVVEAARQIQGRAGERQVPKANSCVVTSGALMDGSAMVLVGDR